LDAWQWRSQNFWKGGGVGKYIFSSKTLAIFWPIFSAFSLESNALKGPLWLARWPAASKTRRRKHVETSGFLH